MTWPVLSSSEGTVDGMSGGTFRVTYATLSADDGELHAAYTAASATVRATLGATHPLWVGDDDRIGETFSTVSPVDTAVSIGRLRRRHRERRR